MKLQFNIIVELDGPEKLSGSFCTAHGVNGGEDTSDIRHHLSNEITACLQDAGIFNISIIALKVEEELGH